jgi:hypothetical protein
MTDGVHDYWRCAVCEGVNDGGEVCSTCGAPRSRTDEAAEEAARREPEPEPEPQPAPPDPAPSRSGDRYTDDDQAGYADERVRYNDPFGFDEPLRYEDEVVYEDDPSLDEADERSGRPRVRVYGCCLPGCLAMGSLFSGVVALLVTLLLRLV